MRWSLKRVLLPAACMLLIGSPVLLGQENEAYFGKKAMESPPAKAEKVAHRTYLGVDVMLPSAKLIENRPEGLLKGQGLFVSAVVADSPADKAGIKPYDVILTFDGQKLFAPGQLVDLVSGDKAGKEVAIEILRDGKTLDVKATLGSRDILYAVLPGENVLGRLESRILDEMPMRGIMPRRMTRVMNSELKAGEKESGWESFDSMTLKKIGNGRFAVEIGYLGKNDKIETKKFEGDARGNPQGHPRAKRPPHL